jgi:Pentapeptide repeats (8 copies)
MEMTPGQLAEILNAHGKWLRGEVNGLRANLRSADLSSADLSLANLSSANLSLANLSSANLRSANLRSANLRSADLRSANLSSANLSLANLSSANLRSADLSSADLRSADLRSAKHSDDALITGEPWSEYLARVVPALLTAGGKTLAEVIESGCWKCHEWNNCPMHVAFGIDSPSKGPLLLRPRIEQFVQLFDAGLIPQPALETVSQ